MKTATNTLSHGNQPTASLIIPLKSSVLQQIDFREVSEENVDDGDVPVPNIQLYMKPRWLSSVAWRLGRPMTFAIVCMPVRVYLVLIPTSAFDFQIQAVVEM